MIFVKPDPIQLAAGFDLRFRVLRQPWQQPRGSEQDDLEAQGLHRVGVDDAGTVVATGRVHPLSPSRGQIRYMAVAPERQGQGLGARLLAALEQAAQQAGLEVVELQAREAQLGFYLAQGYRDIGVGHTLFGTVSHRRMAKVLDSGIARLNEVWHQTIPMADFMKVEGLTFDGRRFCTRASFDSGRNLHGTLFAGAGYSQAVLTGWGRVWLELQLLGMEGDIVLARAEVSYSKPVTETPMAEVESEALNLAPLLSGRNAKVPLTVALADGLRLQALFAVLAERH
ncbi:thioesterase domain-containing protein, putative [Ferrimonas sediminum]|uniref:Thioesterase domain-containing protein, putative n=1 Tax=Ferrimonas sediminum TaxID=718193 RepID=A0A1G8XLM8_9GAMM|nr:YiiD C-terminal domain-containing protein [Ferrimonas sediminum]SDJ90805.1 thioesterase domain-containing protein, putative [Ferrimonas sediminum]